MSGRRRDPARERACGPRKLFNEFTLEQQRLLLHRALELALEAAVSRGLKPRRIVVKVDHLLRALGLPDNAASRAGVISVAREMSGSRLSARGASWVLCVEARRKGRGVYSKRVHVLVLKRVR